MQDILPSNLRKNFSYLALLAMQHYRLAFQNSFLQDSETVWQQLTLDWYGQGERPLEICTSTALWYRYGYDPLPIRWVLTRDPLGKRPRHPPSFLLT